MRTGERQVWLSDAPPPPPPPPLGARLAFYEPLLFTLNTSTHPVSSGLTRSAVAQRLPPGTAAEAQGHERSRPATRRPTDQRPGRAPPPSPRHPGRFSCPHRTLTRCRRGAARSDTAPRVQGLSRPGLGSDERCHPRGAPSWAPGTPLPAVWGDCRGAAVSGHSRSAAVGGPAAPWR